MRIYGDKPKLYQWDSGRRITHAALSAGQAVHFYNRSLKQALVVTAYELEGAVVADIPNILLQSALPIHVYLVCSDQETQFTHASYRFLVTPRPKPDDYVYTETEVRSWEALNAKVEALIEEQEEQIAQAVEDYMAEHPVEVPDSSQNVNQVEPGEDDIPKVFITGAKPATKDDVLAEMEYVSKTGNFHAYLEIKCQGTSSMSYPKKNFTVKLYSDEARETKLKKSFKDWGHNGNKYVLKANWIDHSHARNIVSARLWNEIVESRPDYDSLPEEMQNSPRNGAVDGFPVKVYYNGNYEGVYTWNIGKDDWQWGMDEDNPNHVLLCAEGNTNGNYAETPSNFRALWNGVDGAKPGWSVEVGTNSIALKNSLNTLIQFVMDNDGDAFRNGIGNYLDVQSAIDYYIFQYEICGLDGLAHNMLLATYDGTKWICGAYDLDATFGMWWNGSSFVAATYACPEDYQEDYSLLWERIEANFLPELKARQAELRKTVLSYSNMVTHFERFMDVIGNDLYAEDLTVYTGIPSGSTNNIKQIRNYIRDRQAYVDAEFAAMSAPVSCTGISLNTNTLTFTAEGTQTLNATVTPDGCTDTITWESSNTSVATVNGGLVTAVANGNATITAKCGEYSVNCSVSVSGMSEAVECTGITLDKSVLTFDGEGTQTITVTVTPSDTTDTVVWVSSAPAVASIVVEDNVCTVQSMGNGNATISVTCGNQSASCEVTVSGIESYLYKNYAPNGEKFISEATIDWDTQFVEADIDLTNCLTDEENIFSVGKNIANYSGANSYHAYYSPSTKVVRIGAYTNSGRPYGSIAELKIDSTDVVIRIDKEGVLLNGYRLSKSDYIVTSGGLGDGTGDMYAAFVEYIKTLSTVQIGSTEGGNRSHATYNYIKVETVVPCTGISLDKTELTFTDTNPQTIVATLTPSGSNDFIYWSIDDPKVATVVNGTVIPKRNGSATITVEANGHSATCAITVAVDTSIPWYPLNDGEYTTTYGTTIKIANGNHISASGTGTGNDSIYMNLSNITSQTSNDGRFAAPKLFSIYSGDTIKTVVRTTSDHSISGTFSLFSLNPTGASSGLSDFYKGKPVASNSYENTITASTDVDIGSICMWAYNNNIVGADFDIEIYVNDARYV